MKRPKIRKNAATGAWELIRPPFGLRSDPDVKEYDSQAEAVKALSDINGTASGSYSLGFAYEPEARTRWGFRSNNYPMRIT